MDNLLIIPLSLHIPFKLLTSLAIGLLLGLQRERTPSAKAGLRTFALAALLGTILGLVADATGNGWIVATGLALVGLMIIAAYHGEERPEEDSGTTTEVAMLLCYGLGVMVWYDQSQLAVEVGIVATLLLHFKTELHGFSERLSRNDVASILQFAVVSFIVLPLLPDRGFDHYRVLNPYQIWLMTVLISGVSLSGYLALRLIGARRGLLLVGVFGGLVSSTATTLVYARQSGVNPQTNGLGEAIITISNLVVLVRLFVVAAVVAPAALPVLLPMLGGGLVVGLIPAVLRLRGMMTAHEMDVPALDNPTNFRVALAFGALYAVVLYGSAWLSDHLGNHGLYAIALASGLADVDAISLSSLTLFNSGNIAAATAATAMGLAFIAAVSFKLAVLLFLGGREMFKRCVVSLLAPVAGIVLALLFLA